MNFGDAILPAGLTNPAALPSGAFDGQIGQQELDGVLLNFGSGTGTIAANVAAVPEPGTLILVSLSGLALASRRRCR